MNENDLRKNLNTLLSGFDFPAARQQEVLRQIRGEKPMKKKVSLALVCAIVLTMLMAGAALAAALGVFAQLSSQPYFQHSASQLQKLDEAADFLNIETELEAPAAKETPAAQTVYDQLLKRQYERTFKLTLNQTYYDGNKLYYSYTLQTDQAQAYQGQGMPTGIAEWLMEESGKRYEDVWSNDIPGRDEEIQSWLGSHESSWIAHENWSLGDGASTADGVDLPIIGGDSQLIDASTLQGYQEVELPEELAGSDSLEIELTVLYGTTLYHQDASGVRSAHIAQPENRGILRIPFTVYKNGSAVPLKGEADFADYTAQADLLVSQVDISGKVRLHVPTEWTDLLKPRIEGEDDGDVILSYQLIADGQTHRNLEGSLYVPEAGVLEIGVQFDLPENMQELLLVPEYAKAGLKMAEGIELK